MLVSWKSVISSLSCESFLLWGIGQAEITKKSIKTSKVSQWYDKITTIEFHLKYSLPTSELNSFYTFVFYRINKLNITLLSILSWFFPHNICFYPIQSILTLLLLSMTCPVLANSVDPDQLASDWSESALFAIKYVNFYQKPGSSNLTGWKLEVGVAS